MTAAASRIRRIRAIGAVGAVGCLALCLLSGSAIAVAAENEDIVAARPAEREIELSGFTRARARLPLVSETQGRVESVFYDIGERIGEDGVFARIDDTFVKLELEEVLVRREQLRSQIDYDAREVSRYERLAQQNNAAAAQLDTFEQTLRNNRHELRQLGVQERVLQERLERKQVPAPVGWRVIARTVEPGQWVNAGERIGEVADFSSLVIPFALTPSQFRALNARADQRSGLELLLPDLDRSVPASLYRSNPGFDAETRKIAVELKLDEPLVPQRGGLRALLRLSQPERSGAVLLPARAVRHSYEEYWVEPVDGAPIRVLLLGRAKADSGDLLRVSSPDIVPGDRFRLQSAE
ncbi:MAG: efflux RND transporter periplasmic adaptor subunit [Thiohalocapsa sp.]|nr:efflux RND transporter periplasmic adaptor subunit [Thiohalocapsa sp.]